jgi:transketolase
MFANSPNYSWVKDPIASVRLILLHLQEDDSCYSPRKEIFMTGVNASSLDPAQLDNLCINTIRFLSVDAVEKAKSGHPGLPMGAAPMAYVFWTRFLRHNPAHPHWFNRDRFVLSAGHGSMLLYSLLRLTGYDLPLEQIKQFRQWGSKTPGHPERGKTPGVETTTGPLGQGFANSVGLAIAEHYLSARYNRPEHQIVDHYTYVLVGDGDLMEGVSSEAASLAGHVKLGKLICLYDDNHITLSASTHLTFTEDRARRFEAYGWHTQTVENGNDLEAIDGALRAIPNLLVVRPCDANETAVAWRVAIETRDRPVALVLTRQDVPTLDRAQFAAADGLRRGAYVWAAAPDGKPDIILIGTGSEVSLIVAAGQKLTESGISFRVVSMPSWELFEAQPRSYRDSVFPPSACARLAVEAGATQGWCKYVGDGGDVIGVDRFGASAPGKTMMREYGFTMRNVCKHALKLTAQKSASRHQRSTVRLAHPKTNNDKGI